ncbi:hypothetical protein COCON_G00049190 [Conger conger]|uniref:Uncharacterized protein n=1 Tax=Conger conger TaxID=82655 RepID=A0A9Q1DV50_CONCO|nr:hypothetical protein COCON_G00049190 [Conger conger]
MTEFPFNCPSISQIWRQLVCVSSLSTASKRNLLHCLLNGLLLLQYCGGEDPGQLGPSTDRALAVSAEAAEVPSPMKKIQSMAQMDGGGAGCNLIGLQVPPHATSSDKDTSRTQK